MDFYHVESRGIRKIYVYDGVLRLLHAVLALSTLFLLSTGIYGGELKPGAQQVAIWGLHVASAKVFTAAVILRVIWSLVGTRWALWSELWHWQLWVGYLRDRHIPDHNAKVGHDPIASIAYIGFYALAVVMMSSGWMLAGIVYGLGPLADTYFDKVDGQTLLIQLHDIGFWGVSIFVVAHISALAFHERHRGAPISQAMISGYQYKEIDKE
jgi:Ni,Fe-hydrogenase I cytochrome b subunit